MDGNAIKTLNENILSNKFLENLQEISLRNCKIERMSSDAFSQLKHLTHVSLANNKLLKLPPNLFVGNDDLKSIDFSSNQISSLIAYQLPPLVSLRKIDFSNNGLHAIHPKAFLNLGSSMEVLDLRENHLKTLVRETFFPLHQLKVHKVVLKD